MTAQLTTTQRPTLEQLLEPATAAYGAALDAHGRAAHLTCRCGYEAKTTRGLGIHRSAAEKAASRAFDQAAAELIDAR